MNKDSIEFLTNFVKSMELQAFYIELLKWASIGLVAVLLWYLHKKLNKEEPKVTNNYYYTDKKE
jgi:cyanate permease